MFLTGSYTPRQVIDTLNTVWGYQTKETRERPSGPLSRNYGYAMFANKFYLGFVKERGELIRSSEIEPMVTSFEFARAQELLGRNGNQSRHTHEFPYTGLMVCAYCGQQITGEVKHIGDIRWENYHCSDTYGKCTKKGMDSDKVQQKIMDALDAITIEEKQCKIALENIVRNLNEQTGPIAATYEQQNRALVQIELKLSNLAEMWIAGLMQDARLYKEKETQLIEQRNDLLLETERMRQELEHMRANAMAASNYVVFARENFKVADVARKREIAHALGIKYVFYGTEKKIDLEIKPLLVEIVKYARGLEAPFEVAKSGSCKQKEPIKIGSVRSGGPKGSLLEVPDKLWELLKMSSFPDLHLG